MVLLPYEFLGFGICDIRLAPDSEVGKAVVKASITFTCVPPSDATPSVSRFTKSVHLLQNYECRTNWQNKHTLKAKYSLCTPWRRRRGAEVRVNSFLTSALVEVSGQLHAPDALSPRKKIATNWTGGGVCTRAHRDGFVEEKISCPCQDSNPRPSSP
jgi:hypothetical protein